MKVALDKVIEIVTECKPNGESDISSISVFTGIKEFKVRIQRVYFVFFLPFQRNIINNTHTSVWYFRIQTLHKARYLSLKQCYSI